MPKAGTSLEMHGGSYDPEYRVWSSMKDRCGNEKHPRYKQYGGRGISVCSQWENSYASFIEDMGRRPKAGMTLERLDCDGDYTPKNCIWADYKQQNRNRRGYNVVLQFKNENMTISEIAEITGVHVCTIRDRLAAGRTMEEAVTKGRLKPRSKKKSALPEDKQC